MNLEIQNRTFVEKVEKEGEKDFKKIADLRGKLALLGERPLNQFKCCVTDDQEKQEKEKQKQKKACALLYDGENVSILPLLNLT